MFITRQFRRSLSRLLPRVPWGDRVYAAIDFWGRHRRLPRVYRPVSFNDHLIGLRTGIQDAIELRRTVVDKIHVKEYVGRTVGSRYALETVAVLSAEEDVENFSPPAPCIFKATHMSGSVLIVRENEAEFDRKVIKSWLRADYYLTHREWFYKDLSKRVIVEKIFSDDGITPPDDFKVYCFGGHPKLIQVDQGRFTKHTRVMYTVDWRRMPVDLNYPPGRDVSVPPLLPEMLDVASELASPFAFIRVDFLAARSQLKVTELTNCPEAARGRWTPVDADQKLGRLFTDPETDVLELLRT